MALSLLSIDLPNLSSHHDLVHVNEFVGVGFDGGARGGRRPTGGRALNEFEYNLLVA